jgi:putative transposase
VARVHRRVANVRRHHLHVLSTRLAKSHGRLVIEDLNVRGMTSSARGTVARPGHHVRAKAGQNRAVLDAGFAGLRRMLTYKCAWYGSRLVVADRWFPSSRRCSACGAIRELPRNERVYRCPSCDLVMDRDVNAARNLAWWAEAHDVACSARETQNGRGGAAAIRPLAGETSDEATTGTVLEPAGVTTDGRHRVGLPIVPA